MEDWKKIVVSKKIKPINFPDRVAVELVVGNDYYISFGNNRAKKCKLTEINKKDGLPDMVTVEVYHKPNAKSYIRSNSVYADEIGLTPEGAVKHEVTW